MKRYFASAALILSSNLSSILAQGTMGFDSVFSAPAAPVTIATEPGRFNPSGGPPGAFVGSNYTASLFFLNGTVTNQAVFDNSGPMLFSAADRLFLGTTGTGTGHGWTGDGSGFFDGPEVDLTAASGLTVTVEVRAWYNGNGQYTSYFQALSAGQNIGESNPILVFLALPFTNPQNLDGLQAFTIGIPEPSASALCVVSLGLWWASRRARH